MNKYWPLSQSGSGKKQLMDLNEMIGRECTVESNFKYIDRAKNTKTTIRYHFPLTRMPTIIKKTDNDKCW